MTDGNLITGLLNFDVLVGDESRRFSLEDQLTVDPVSLALLRWALHDWVEFFSVDELIDLESAAITREDSNLHAWLHITGTSDNTTDCNELSDVLSPDLSHLDDLLLAELSWHEDSLIVALKFGRDSRHWICVSSRVLTSDEASLKFDIACHLQVESSLFHDHIKASLIFFSEVQAGLWHMHVDDLTEHLDVGGGISYDSLDKAMVTISTIQSISG